MMQVIKCKTRVDAEGQLIFQLPKSLANQELDVAIPLSEMWEGRSV